MRLLRAVIPAALCAVVAVAQEPLAEAERGLAGVLTFTFDGPPLEAKPQLDLSAPILLRLERTSDAESTYAAHFLGAVAGTFDLRTLIQRADGGSPVGLDPLPVLVHSNLGDEFSTDLYDAADLDVAFSGRYRLLAWLAAILWLAVPAFVIARRVLRRPPPVPEAPPAPPPTLADQLRPLCTAARARELSVSEQARLELLLYHFWRERLDLSHLDVALAVRRVREHSEAGAVLHAVEGWLHRPDGEPVDIDALLRPYLEEPAIPESALAREEAR